MRRVQHAWGGWVFLLIFNLWERYAPPASRLSKIGEWLSSELRMKSSSRLSMMGYPSKVRRAILTIFSPWIADERSILMLTAAPPVRNAPRILIAVEYTFRQEIKAWLPLHWPSAKILTLLAVSLSLSVPMRGSFWSPQYWPYSSKYVIPYIRICIQCRYTIRTYEWVKGWDTPEGAHSWLVYLTLLTQNVVNWMHTDLRKKANESGLKPASCNEVNPTDRAALTVVLNRRARSSSFGGGLIIRSCALSRNTPTYEVGDKNNRT